MEQRVRVAAGRVRLAADLAIPAAAKGMVLFAHGSGSGRLSPRQPPGCRQAPAGGPGHPAAGSADRRGGDGRARRRSPAFRRRAAGRPARRRAGLAGHRAAHRQPAVGLFGASTGAGAALLVAADRPAAVAAVVSRGGRPDLAGAVLGRVRARTLLVVGGRDRTVLALNRAALEGLTGRARLEVVPGASHLFPEPGALERVAELAVARFLAHLAGELASEQATS
jgi:putative phosphoribosyl transferase